VAAGTTVLVAWRATTEALSRIHPGYGRQVTWRKRLEARLGRGNPWAAISFGVIWLLLGVGLLIGNVVVSQRQHWVTMTLDCPAVAGRQTLLGAGSCCTRPEELHANS